MKAFSAAKLKQLAPHSPFTPKPNTVIRADVTSSGYGITPAANLAFSRADAIVDVDPNHAELVPAGASSHRGQSEQVTLAEMMRFSEPRNLGYLFGDEKTSFDALIPEFEVSLAQAKSAHAAPQLKVDFKDTSTPVLDIASLPEHLRSVAERLQLVGTTNIDVNTATISAQDIETFMKDPAPFTNREIVDGLFEIYKSMFSVSATVSGGSSSIQEIFKHTDAQGREVKVTETINPATYSLKGLLANQKLGTAALSHPTHFAPAPSTPSLGPTYSLVVSDRTLNFAEVNEGTSSRGQPMSSGYASLDASLKRADEGSNFLDVDGEKYSVPFRIADAQGNLVTQVAVARSPHPVPDTDCSHNGGSVFGVRVFAPGTSWERVFDVALTKS